MQAVSVARGYRADGVAAVARESAENIVRLISGLFNYRHAHRLKQLLEHGHLLRELIGHTLSCRFVAAVHLMAESRLFDIKSDRHRLRPALVFEAQKNIHKAIDGVGESAVLRREHLYAVKRAVQYAVAVNNKKVHVQPPSFESKILYYTTQAAICILFYILFPFI